jgi:predicted nucleotidyltransferase
MESIMKKIIEMEFGSRVYGTNLPTSDTDFKAIAIPSGRDIILQRAFKTIQDSTGNDQTRNTQDDIDKETFSLHYFMRLLTEGQTVCLDMLFTPYPFYKTASISNADFYVWKM